jgi:hypothetical protein
MPTKTARKGARNAKRRGNKASTQAGSYVKQQMRRKKHGGGGKHRPKSRKQAIAIGLSEARKAGVHVKKKTSGGRKSSKKK